MSRATLFLALSAAGAAPALTLESLQATPVVPGVSMITEGPAKGHSAYDEANDQMVPVWIDATTLQTVATAAAIYAGGLRVNSGHFTELTEAAGFLTAFTVEGPQLRATLNLFRTYSQFAHLCELICTIPDTFGFSIDFEGEAEFAGGKALARCTTIYSCDLVPAPAANDRAANDRSRRPSRLTPDQAALARRLFDNLPPANPVTPMADSPTPPPAAPAPAAPHPAPPAPPAPPAAPTAEENAKAISDAVTAALAPALETALAPLKTELTGLTQRLTTVEAELKAAAGAEPDPAAGATPPAMSALRSRVRALESQLGAQATKLARRFGLEFAARAGANPLEHPAAPGGEETRAAHQIPTSEHNLRALQALRPTLPA